MLPIHPAPYKETSEQRSRARCLPQPFGGRLGRTFRTVHIAGPNEDSQPIFVENIDYVDMPGNSETGVVSTASLHGYLKPVPKGNRRTKSVPLVATVRSSSIYLWEGRIRSGLTM